MPNFIALGCVEVGEKFRVVGSVVVGGVYLIAKNRLIQPEVEVRLGCNN